ncbi:MAG: phenylalanine--tRNA ligase subunit alpha [Candidatus Pacebacteria bacterium]|nr:phenylalanine--tRNA ligase subunit alpha [Candidatus Paceibacterota bacterium]
MKGHLHPLTQTIDDVVRILTGLGFSLDFGPEVETEENNFDLLNIPKDHPARDMQDTFAIEGGSGKLPRTQTSAHQVPYMRDNELPIRMFSFGKVFRNEATDATHESAFYQVEGLAVDSIGNITLGQLKWTLETFLKEMFGKDVKMRLRPGYFPFVEPGVEVDMYFNGKWTEMLGAGMVHPKVLENAGLDPKKHAGYAFGVGIDRLMLARNGVSDIRYSYQGDLRFVNQF